MTALMAGLMAAIASAATVASSRGVTSPVFTSSARARPSRRAYSSILIIGSPFGSMRQQAIGNRQLSELFPTANCQLPTAYCLSLLPEHERIGERGIGGVDPDCLGAG